MRQPRFHLMQAVLIEDRATMRYECPICERCVEDGPEGLTVVHAGDRYAEHRGGTLTTIEQSAEQPPPAGPRLH